MASNSLENEKFNESNNERSSTSIDNNDKNIQDPINNNDNNEINSSNSLDQHNISQNSKIGLNKNNNIIEDKAITKSINSDENIIKNHSQTNSVKYLNDEKLQKEKERLFKLQKAKEKRAKFEITINNIKTKISKKQQYLNSLLESNLELEEKLNKICNQYKDIENSIESNSISNKNLSSNNLINLINLKEKEIFACNSEISYYKSQIELLKKNMEFNNHLNIALNLEKQYKNEMTNKKNLQYEYDVMLKNNYNLEKTINNLDKETKFKEKIKLLKDESKNIKETIKVYLEKHNKEEMFLKSLHDKLVYLDNSYKSIITFSDADSNPINSKNNNKKFSKNDLNSLIKNIFQTRDEINNLKNIQKESLKNNEDSIKNLKHKDLLIINNDYKEQEKTNKMLIFKRNELKRLIKAATDKNEKINSINTYSNSLINNSINNKKVLNSTCINNNNKSQIKNINRLMSNNGDISNILHNKNEFNYMEGTNLPDVELSNDEENNENNNEIIYENKYKSIEKKISEENISCNSVDNIKYNEDEDYKQNNKSINKSISSKDENINNDVNNNNKESIT